MSEENKAHGEIAYTMEENEVEKFTFLQREIMESYTESVQKNVELETWLSDELEKHLPGQSKEDIQTTSKDILNSLKTSEEMKKDLQRATASGRSKESWFASKLKEAASLMNTQESMRYLGSIDEAIKNAKAEMFDTVTTKAGITNMNRNLDGFIAEQHHVNSFNLNAQAANQNIYAEVLKPKPGQTYGKGSVDVVIKNEAGKIIRRYQAKYGATAEDTIRMVKDGGGYPGQQLLVPEEQLDAVQKAFPNRKVCSTIREEGITSNPLSKEEAKSLQKEVQKGNPMDLNWSGLDAKEVAKNACQCVGEACLMGAALGAGLDIAGKAYRGEPIEGAEVVEAALESGSDAGVKAATAAALKVATENDLLNILPKGTPASTYANAAFVIVEDVKVMGKVASGEYTAEEGLDKLEETTVACVAGAACATKGAAIGAAVGTAVASAISVVIMVYGSVPAGAAVFDFLYRPSAAIGSVIGSSIGYMVGSKTGENVVKGKQKACKRAAKKVKEDGLTQVASNVLHRLETKLLSI